MANKFDQIWDEFGGRIRAFIYRRISNHDDIDDILQEVFLKIHLNIDKLEEDSKLAGWIYKIAQNTIIDYYRKRKIHLDNIDVMEIGIERQDEEPEDNIASGLIKMIEALPEKYALSLILVEFQGLSIKEMAEKLGISESAAKSRIQRGRRLIRDSLMNCCHFEFDRFGTIIDFHPITCCCCHNS
ncbi:MAG: RNA polymerase sigma factor SigZ [Brevinematales bacterium]|jgi:RNA polymerase sigma-70 factor (ECF subfamily)